MIRSIVRWAALALLSLSLGAGCAPLLLTPATASPESLPPLTMEDLQSAEYEFPDIGIEDVILHEGTFERTHGTGATQVTKVGLIDAAFGDLNLDAAGDAATILYVDTGGSGTFIYLTAMVNREGRPHQAAYALLGDRVKVESLSIEGGKIVIQAVEHGPTDPMCCPSQEVALVFELDGENLKVSGAD